MCSSSSESYGAFLRRYGFGEQLVEVVLDARARRGRHLAEIAVEALLVDVGPVDERLADLEAIVELPRAVLLLEERVVLQRPDERP